MVNHEQQAIDYKILGVMFLLVSIAVAGVLVYNGAILWAVVAAAVINIMTRFCFWRAKWNMKAHEVDLESRPE